MRSAPAISTATASRTFCGRIPAAPTTIWQMDGSHPATPGPVYTVDPSWHAIAPAISTATASRTFCGRIPAAGTTIWQMDGKSTATPRSCLHCRPELACDRHRRFQRRQQVGHSAAEYQRRPTTIWQMDGKHRDARSCLHCRPELACDRHRRFQRRRQVGHSVAEYQRRHDDLADGRQHRDARSCL